MSVAGDETQLRKYPVGIDPVALGEAERRVPTDEAPPLAPNADLKWIGKSVPRINGRAKVIIITGYPSPEVREEAMGNGAFYFYEKSKDISELLHSVQKALSANPS